MADISVELKISSLIGAASSQSTTYVPASGKKVKIRAFESGGENTTDLIYRLYWKYNLGGSATLLWTAAASMSMPFVVDIPDGEVNGTNSIGMVVENQKLSSFYMSAYALVEVKD